MIGRRDRLPQLLLREIEKAEFATSEGKCITVRVAVDYSSRDAISRAAVCVDSALERSELQSPEQARHLLSQTLTAESRDVDLLIRTGGEKRLSDFLLWESAYAELLFTDRMWPDFSADDLSAAVEEFGRRQRRFGGLPIAVSQSAAKTRDGVL